VGAAFADVDKDGDLDLYVVSGGSEPDKSPRVLDRLYLNDGSGKFNETTGALPGNRYNGSCIVQGDFNGDGNVDFFVGGRSTPHEYGVPGISRILINKGKGTFSDQTSGYLRSNGRIGMVTDAAWSADTRELIVVGEWMPITIYKYYADSISIQIIPNSSGWWNTIHLDDLDEDGDMDFLVGNMGLNTNLSASPAEPLELYVWDYDLNLTLDPIISYYRDGQKWTYPGLDELSQQIRDAKKVERTYESYSSRTFSEIFPEERLQTSLHQQAQILASVWVENRGQEGFEMHALPVEAQISPIYGFLSHDFNGDGYKDILTVGNFYGNQPSIGKCDASFGTLLKGSGQGNFEEVKHRESGFAVYGEARDVKIMNSENQQKLVLVSRNNTETRLFRVNHSE
jgi:hypothetical protein